MKKNLIIDGNNLVHRAFWVTKNHPHLNHISILLKSLKLYKDKFKPVDMYCAWDSRTCDESPFRKTESSEYKGTRDVDYNEEVHEQTQTVEDIFESLGILNMHPRRGEADDIMFYLSKQLDGSNVIVTVDTDMLQLIDEKTSVFSPIKKVEYTTSKFIADYGMHPSEYARYKSITGDSADNVIGLNKFGNKRALNVLKGITTLTEEQKNIVETNLKLIALDNRGIDMWDEEYSLYGKQLKNGTPNPKFDKFIQLCEENNMHDTLRDESYWHNEFFMKNALNDTIAKLFA